MNMIRWTVLGLMLPAFAVAGCSQDKEGTAGGTQPAPATAHDSHSGHDHATAAPAAKEETKPVTVAQTECPVMGKPIDKAVYTDHEGRRVYFCCPGCIDTFKKDPAQYLAKLK